ncbi:MAG: D-alanyl-D-alanine carboxypeptidase/D-alanyl-D-alanine-endopeptidase [Bacteroidota bacterium]
MVVKPSPASAVPTSFPRTPRVQWLILLAFALQACSGSHQLSHYASEKGSGIFTRDAELARKIDELLPDTLFPPSNIALVIGSLRDGQVIYERNADMLFTPASNQKLFTSAAALTILGPLSRLETRVAVDSLKQTIYLEGGGDPILTTSDLEDLATTVVLHLPFRENWKVVGDPSRFDSVYWGRGWMWDDASDPSGMGVSALTVNSNTIDLHIEAGDSVGAAPRVFTVPTTDFVRILNRATVVDSVVHPLEVMRHLQHPSNQISVQGEIARRAHRTETVAVWEPDFYAANLFAGALQKMGVHVSEITLDTVPRNVQETAVVSHRLDSVITFMNKVSDNLSAECILKTLGAAESGAQGTWNDGTHAVRMFLQSIQLDTAGLVIADGSGLSRYNLTTSRAIFRLLKAMHEKPTLWPVFAASLPIAGKDGTLEDRMMGTIAESRVHAKTGSMSGVSSLSGFVETRDSQLLGFSMMMENFAGPTRAFRAVQDSIASFLVSYHAPLAPMP